MLWDKFSGRCKAFRWSRLVYKSMVLGVGTTGLVALQFKGCELEAIASQIATHGRALLRGRACERAEGRYKAKTNEWVLKRIQIPPMYALLRVQRLKWWQSIVRYPNENMLLLSVMFWQVRVGPVSIFR